MHVETNMLNNISNVRPGEHQVLKGASETPKLCGIRHRRAEVGGELGLKVNNRGATLATYHPCDVQECHACRSTDAGRARQIVVPLRC